MAQETAPASPRLIGDFIAQDGRLTRDGMAVLVQMWRQIAAGFVIVPCLASGTNAIALTPILHEEGGRSYADHMVFAAVAANTSTNSVTAGVADLPDLKVYKSGGATQAGSGDVVANALYLFVYNSALDAGAGGLVLFGWLDADLAVIAALADPNADRILFWDDSAGSYAFLAPSTGILITTTNLTVDQSFTPTWTGAHTWTVAAPQITLNNATSNWIVWTAGVGVAPPAFTTPSVGTKLRLHPSISGSLVDYAIGIDTSTLWFSVPAVTDLFKFYGATTLGTTLTGAGALTLASTLSFNGTAALTGLATQAIQETATSAVTLVTPSVQHHHPSACKVWCKFNLAGTIAAHFNVTSITDTGAGDWTVNIATDFSSTAYAAVADGGVASGGVELPFNTLALTGGTCQIVSRVAGAGTDPAFNEEIFFIAFGDQ